MARKYIRKTNIEVNENIMKNALKEHFKNKVPVRTAARLYDLNRNTLVSRIRIIKTKKLEHRYEHSSDSGMSENEDSRVFKNKYTVNQVKLEHRYEHSSDSGMSENEDSRVFKNKYTVNQVFSNSDEAELVSYIERCSDLHYGLSYWQIRLLAFDFALQIPESPVTKPGERGFCSENTFDLGLMMTS
ncbi:hypothetical protein QE152_g30367 [Popillia japonica]|uniref:HTH psq-type domain-containing protein n=1 Tax=Popillia japonica TaxID=7064 RepID=A0AAW1JE31_POPJA